MLTWKRGPRQVAIEILWRIAIAAMVLIGVLALFAAR